MSHRQLKNSDFDMCRYFVELFNIEERKNCIIQHHIVCLGFLVPMTNTIPYRHRF